MLDPSNIHSRVECSAHISRRNETALKPLISNLAAGSKLLHHPTGRQRSRRWKCNSNEICGGSAGLTASQLNNAGCFQSSWAQIAWDCKEIKRLRVQVQVERKSILANALDIASMSDALGSRVSRLTCEVTRRNQGKSSLHWVAKYDFKIFQADSCCCSCRLS